MPNRYQGLIQVPRFLLEFLPRKYKQTDQKKKKGKRIKPFLFLHRRMQCKCRGQRHGVSPTSHYLTVTPPPEGSGRGLVRQMGTPRWGQVEALPEVGRGCDWTSDSPGSAHLPFLGPTGAISPAPVIPPQRLSTPF